MQLVNFVYVFASLLLVVFYWGGAIANLYHAIKARLKKEKDGVADKCAPSFNMMVVALVALVLAPISLIWSMAHIIPDGYHTMPVTVVLVESGDEIAATAKIYIDTDSYEDGNGDWVSDQHGWVETVTLPDGKNIEVGGDDLPFSGGDIDLYLDYETFIGRAIIPPVSQETIGVTPSGLMSTMKSRIIESAFISVAAVLYLWKCFKAVKSYMGT